MIDVASDIGDRTGNSSASGASAAGAMPPAKGSALVPARPPAPPVQEVASGGLGSPAAVESLPLAERGPGQAGTEPEEKRQGPESAPGYDTTTQFEQIVSRVLFGYNGDGFLLAVTSAVAGEGVTTTSVGVALALAQCTTKSVLLVDANLRRPAIYRFFEAPREPGLSDLVLGYECGNWRESPPDPERFPAAGILRTTMPSLWILPAGSPLENPTPVLTSDTARASIRFLKSQFDYVVIDCPPVLSSIDAASICRLADGVAVVVRAGFTPREDVSSACQRLRESSIMGVVLNAM